MEGKSPKVKVIEVSKIEISIGTRKIDLTPEEARKLFSELKNLFDNELCPTIEAFKKIMAEKEREVVFIPQPYPVPSYPPIYVEPWKPYWGPSWICRDNTACDNNAHYLQGGAVCQSTLSISC